MKPNTIRYLQHTVYRAMSAFIVLLTLNPESTAAIVNYTSEAAFTDAVGSHPIIRFNEVPVGTTLSSQYLALGVTFPEGNDTTAQRTAYLSDNFGLFGNGTISLQFSSLTTAVAANFPGALEISLYVDAVLIGTSQNFGSSGAGFFGGVTSDIPFNRAVLSDRVDSEVSIDNIHIVPEPSATLLLGATAYVFMLFRPRRMA